MEPITLNPWYRRSTLYHIYPLSFADSNGDGFGDIRGIIDHLDYLNNGEASSLGVTALWLSPVYVSPMADWGYDVADHKAIDPRFGTMTDFDELLHELHIRGMKLLMDFVPNHTSILHPWFLDSRSGLNSLKRDWYIWANPNKDGGPPNNWLSYFGGPAWSLDGVTGQYYLHTFLKEQPDLNWRNQEVRDSMLDVLRFWLNKGVDGFRTDAVLGIIKDSKLRDDPMNPNYREGETDPAEKYLRIHSAGQTELSDVISSFCDVLAEKESAFLLTEAYLNIPGMHQMYLACSRHPVHAPFNFNLMGLQWSAKIFRSFIDEYELSLGHEDWPNYVLGNHDRNRLVSRVGAGRARLLAVLQMTLRGLPVVYYGEELGLPDTPVGLDKARDSWTVEVGKRRLSRDPERTPMPWSGENKAGFTVGTPWLPIGPAAAALNVAHQALDTQSSLHLYQHLIHLRSHAPALIEGDYRSIESGNENIFAYVRETQQQRFMVLLNFDSDPATAKLHGKVGRWVAGTHNVEGDGEFTQPGEVILRSYEGRVYELTKRDM